MAETENLITKITRRDGDSFSEFDIGTSFKNIFHESKENNEIKLDFSLDDFYNHYANFIENGTFMMYSEKEPKEDQVKVWWQIKEENG